MILQGLIFGGGGGGSPFPLADSSSMGWADALFFRTGANSIAQRNSTNAQTFRVYGTYTDASNGDWLNFTKTAGGAATISTGANGTGTAHDLVLQAGAASDTLTMSRFGGVYLNGASFYFGSASSSPALIPGTNVLTLNCFSAGSFQRLNFSGTSSSFPALKRNGVGFDVVRADDTAGSFIRVTGVTVANLPAAGTAGAGARAYVTDATATLTAGIGATVTGGGANPSPVWSDGTNWRQG